MGLLTSVDARLGRLGSLLARSLGLGANARTRRLCAAAALALFTLVFVQNAWVSEDAYITFRSVEQLLAGNGPRWNPHERVQAFTHPLWFGVMAVFRLFSRDVFIHAIIATYLCSALALLVLARRFGFSGRWLLCVLVLTVSRAFVDFSSSGLENPLAFLLLALFLVSFLDEKRREPTGGAASGRSVAWFSLLFALALCTRHDLGTLLLPAMAYVVWRHRGLGWRPTSGAVLLGLALFLLWTAFSLFYYGFPVPNTAYAKLNTGVPEKDLLAQGLAYLWSDLWWDPITPGLVLLTILVAAARRNAPFQALSLGLLLNVVYVLSVGGDFMHGRFWTAAFFVAVPVLVELWSGSRTALTALAAACLALVALEPNAPIKTSDGYVDWRFDRHGIADERGFYFGSASLWEWFRWNPRRDGRLFPRHGWAIEGLKAGRDDQMPCPSSRNVGYFGYWAGVRKPIIDVLALADPLLARLPCEPGCRIGHFMRKIPDGYPESILTGENRIKDPHLARFYDKLRLITRGPLWSAERLKTIVAMNLGYYNGDLKAYIRAQRAESPGLASRPSASWPTPLSASRTDS